MSFSTISTFSTLKFSSGPSFIYIYPAFDISMSIYYPFNNAISNKIPNYNNAINGITSYDGTLFGSGSINNTLPNYIIGNGSLSVTNIANTNSNTSTQYVQNTNTINTSGFNNEISISIWFNPSDLSGGNIYTLFDIASSVNNKGIQLNLMGTNAIYSALYYA